MQNNSPKVFQWLVRDFSSILKKMQNAYEIAIGHYKQKYFIMSVKRFMSFLPHFWTFKNKILAFIAVRTYHFSLSAYQL